MSLFINFYKNQELNTGNTLSMSSRIRIFITLHHKLLYPEKYNRFYTKDNKHQTFSQSGLIFVGINYSFL